MKTKTGKVGRPRKIRISKKARTRTFGNAARGARTPGQIRAAIKREAVRTRASWKNSRYKKSRYR